VFGLESVSWKPGTVTPSHARDPRRNGRMGRRDLSNNKLTILRSAPPAPRHEGQGTATICRITKQNHPACHESNPIFVMQLSQRGKSLFNSFAYFAFLN